MVQVWYTQWKRNRPEESGRIELENFKEVILGKYFPRDMREVKAEEFIKLKQGNVSVEEYSLKLSKLLKYAPSLSWQIKWMK